jgi:hypothetical protein
MVRNDNILNELNEISPGLANIPPNFPFQIPEGYFDDFPDMVLDLVNREQNSMEVPAGYFESFAGNMLAKAKKMDMADEIHTVAPFLNHISKEMPFYLPEGYFEQLKIQPKLETVEIKPEVKVVPLISKGFRKWATAAAILITAGIGWMIFSNEEKTVSYRAKTVEPVENILTDMDVSSMESFLTAETESWEFADFLITANENIESGIQTLSTAELKTYLDNYPELDPGS